MKNFNDYIKSIKEGTDLSENESENAFDQILLQKVSKNETFLEKNTETYVQNGSERLKTTNLGDIVHT